MYAITTKYHGPTNTKGARISASADEHSTVYISYPYDLSGEAVHREALAAYLAKQGWLTPDEENPDNWVGGWMRTGYAFVFVGK